jgi:hypothetical protein
VVRPGRAELAAAVGSSPVVVGLVLGQNPAQVAFAEDQHPAPSGGSPRRGGGPRIAAAPAADGTGRIPGGCSCNSWRPSSSRQSSCCRAKITVKGGRRARVAGAMALHATLDTDFPRQGHRAYREDGAAGSVLTELWARPSKVACWVSKGLPRSGSLAPVNSKISAA